MDMDGYASHRQSLVLYLVYFTDFISCSYKPQSAKQSKVTETNLIVFIFPFYFVKDSSFRSKILKLKAGYLEMNVCLSNGLTPKCTILAETVKQLRPAKPQRVLNSSATEAMVETNVVTATAAAYTGCMVCVFPVDFESTSSLFLRGKSKARDV